MNVCGSRRGGCGVVWVVDWRQMAVSLLSLCSVMTGWSRQRSQSCHMQHTHTRLMIHCHSLTTTHQQPDSHLHHTVWSAALRKSPSHSSWENVPVFQLHFTKFLQTYFTVLKLGIVHDVHCSEMLDSGIHWHKGSEMGEGTPLHHDSIC